ncbi:hypothetical protein Tco_1554382 [Tanacetum coccineum]
MLLILSQKPLLLADETVYKEWEDRMERAVTTASSLEVEQDSGSGPKCQDTILGGVEAQTRFEVASKWSINPPPSRVNTLGSGEDSMKLMKLMEHCTKLSELGEGSTITVESHHTPISAPSISQPPTSPPSMQTTHVAKEAAAMPHDSPLPGGHTPGSDEGSMTLTESTVLLNKLEHKVKTSQARRRVKIVISNDEDNQEDPSKQERQISQIDEDKGITLVQTSAQTQGRHEHDFEEPNFEFTTPEEVYTAEPDISIAGAEVSTASPEVRTAAESLVYIKRSAAKRKDKGKAIKKETEPVRKKTKLQLEQERLGLEEALRLQEQLDEEERQRIARVQEEASTFNTKE